MEERDKEQIVARLSARYGRAAGAPVQETLERMVAAGASRFGVRADQPERAGFSACDLAPPLARMIDHTALKPETPAEEIEHLCDEARKYCFATVCVNPCYVPLAAERLKGSPVGICTVIGFPLGATMPEVKARETAIAIRDGATEVDMVVNVGWLKSRRYDDVEADIRAVVQAAREAGRNTRTGARVLTKVILETALLTDEEKVIACILSQNAGADYVKTSTGFSKGGATAADVALMRRTVGDRMGVKASGGIRSIEDAETMIAHGATRLGASASVAILQGLQSDSSY